MSRRPQNSNLDVRKAKVFQNNILAGYIEELPEKQWRFTYIDGYEEAPVSLTMPVSEKTFEFSEFPPAFEGLLPEGLQLEMMLRLYKIDRKDLFKQLMVVGKDVVGSLTFEEIV
jgi:serine/threonine-protein kinase HipA